MGRLFIHLVVIIVIVIVTPAGAAAVLHFTPLMSVFYPEQMEYGSVDRKDQLSGVVYYKVPFHTPPRLKNNSQDHREQTGFVIVDQDEFGFSWVAKDLRIKIEFDPRTGPMGTPEYASRFSWIAEGTRGKPGKIKPRAVEQTGTFNSVAGEQGEVNFVQPFQTPPNIEIKGSDLTLVAETRATGFRWKNAGKDLKDSKNVSWKAKGMLAQ